MDEFDSRKPSDSTEEVSNRKQDTFWMRRLQEAEEQDPDR